MKQESFPLSTSESSKPYLIISVGVDASGKSTTLNTLRDRLGFQAFESTSTPEAKTFKKKHLNTPLTVEMVQQREEMYLRLTADAETHIKREMAAGESVATIDSPLVTRLSHAVMRQVIDPGIGPNHQSSVVHSWIDSNYVDTNIDTLALTHAPHETIMDRIVSRQQAGDKTEKFWGFNSPHFINLYQTAWHQAFELIAVETDLTCLSFDTSIESPEVIVEQLQTVIGQREQHVA